MMGVARTALLAGGAVTVAAAPSFDPNFEYIPDPGFDDPAQWTIAGTGVSITGSAFVANGSTTSNAAASCTAAGTLAAGTYTLSIVVSANGNVANLPWTIAGNTGTIPTGGGTGTFIVTGIVWTSFSNQTIKIAGSFFSNKSITIDSVSLKRTD